MTGLNVVMTICETIETILREIIEIISIKMFMLTISDILTLAGLTMTFYSVWYFSIPTRISGKLFVNIKPFMPIILFNQILTAQSVLLILLYSIIQFEFIKTISVLLLLITWISASIILSKILYFTILFNHMRLSEK